VSNAMNSGIAYVKNALKLPGAINRDLPYTLH